VYFALKVTCHFSQRHLILFNLIMITPCALCRLVSHIAPDI